jgi:D-alanyl-lipoteichoic acid acyltransferase DltB (MBOAT superfamily)
MTLSRFLRDYLYIPLGGNRGAPWHVTASLMVTMLLGGLWHGASWSFMLWGGLHGGFLIVHRQWSHTALSARLAAMKGAPALAWRWVCIALTFDAVCLAWCFFRVTQWQDSLTCVRKLFAFDPDKMFAGGTADLSLWTLLALYGVAVFAVRALTRFAELPAAAARMDGEPFTRGMLWGCSFGVMALALLLAPRGQVQPFIYFQF